MDRLYSIFVIFMIAGVICVGIYSPYTQAASKVRGQVAGLSNFADTPSDTESSFSNLVPSFGIINDYFFRGNSRSAFAVDYYSMSEFESVNAGADASDSSICSSPPCNTATSQGGRQGIRRINVMLGYRYHFSSYHASTGYLGIGVLIDTFGFGDLLGNFGVATINALDMLLNDTREVARNSEGRICCAPAISGGYDWKLGGKKNILRKNPLVMGIHIMVAPAITYGDLEGGNVFNIGYTVGGIVGSK